MNASSIVLTACAMIAFDRLRAPDVGVRELRSDDGVRVVRVEHDPATTSLRHAEARRPPLRGYRPMLASEGDAAAWPIELSSSAPPEHALAAAWVASHLASDGLLATLAHAAEELGERALRAEPSARVTLLRAIGLPVDLLDSFRLPARPDEDGQDLVAYAFTRIAAGASGDDVASELARAEFRFVAHHPPFVAATESGEAEPALLRVQLTAGSYWNAAGDGSSIDLVHGVLDAFPEVRCLASIGEKHLAAFLETTSGWKELHPDRITLVVDDLALSQWAQDNGKAGWLERSDGQREIATLVPRYASRGEDGSTFLSADTFVWDGLSRTGHAIAHSPLLFQGGNLLVVRHPKTGERLLLVGEAELYRNVALGLSAAEVLEAFRSEFRADRCFVLPAVAFHVDYELCVRAIGDELVAFVQDADAGVRVVLESGVRALESGGALDASAARESLAMLARGESAPFLERVGSALSERAHEYGKFPESLARSFSAGSADSGAGNFQCFLLALDRLSAKTLKIDSLATDRHTRAYLQSFVREAADRAALHAGLTELGFELVRVPGIPEEERGINYLNGVHVRSRYLMPAYGGLFEPLDRAAEETFAKRLPSDVRVVRIPSAESQRRSGAVHCSVAVYSEP